MAQIVAQGCRARRRGGGTDEQTPFIRASPPPSVPCGWGMRSEAEGVTAVIDRVPISRIPATHRTVHVLRLPGTAVLPAAHLGRQVPLSWPVRQLRLWIPVGILPMPLHVLRVGRTGTGGHHVRRPIGVLAAATAAATAAAAPTTTAGAAAARRSLWVMRTAAAASAPLVVAVVIVTGVGDAGAAAAAAAAAHLVGGEGIRAVVMVALVVRGGAAVRGLARLRISFAALPLRLRLSAGESLVFGEARFRGMRVISVEGEFRGEVRAVRAARPRTVQVRILWARTGTGTAMGHDKRDVPGVR